MLDYKAFLGKKSREVLLYLGTAFVEASDRRLRLAGDRPRCGFHEFEISGRRATWVGETGAPDMSGLAPVRGHLVAGCLFGEQGLIEQLALVPDEEPAPLSPVVARRWPSDDLLFDSLEFEGAAEEQARQRLEEGASMQGIAGASPTLRAAFAYGRLSRAAKRLGVRLSPVEARPHLALVARCEPYAVDAVLAEIEAERARARERTRVARLVMARQAAGPVAAQPVQVVAQTSAPRRARAPGLSPEDRAEQVLEAAGARMGSARRVGPHLEVSYRYMGQRFITLVEFDTFQVVDAGICLAGADKMATLDSMPSIIKEAIETDKLVITRHG